MTAQEYKQLNDNCVNDFLNILDQYPDNPDEIDIEIIQSDYEMLKNSEREYNQKFYNQFPWYQIYWCMIPATESQRKEAEKIYREFMSLRGQLPTDTDGALVAFSQYKLKKL